MTAISPQPTPNFSLWQRPPLFNFGRNLRHARLHGLLQEQRPDAPWFLLRHHTGDWGDLDPEDVGGQSLLALHYGSRLLSFLRNRQPEAVDHHQPTVAPPLFSCLRSTGPWDSPTKSGRTTNSPPLRSKLCVMAVVSSVRIAEEVDQPPCRGRDADH